MAEAQASILTIRHAYRHLYRELLRAVQYSQPARYVVRDQIRDAFYKGETASFNPGKIAKTLVFLEGATREKGLEHRILKNLVHTAYWRKENLTRLVACWHV
jgi:hypothetical protein